MIKLITGLIFWSFPLITLCQNTGIETFTSDSSMIHASVSICIIDADSGKIICQYNTEKSLIQASILKLITTASALELLGKDYTFKTSIGYSGELRNGSKKLSGNLIIKGGGDPALGSENFPDHYNGFIDKWISDIKSSGIRKIKGSVVADDSFYNYEPAPAGWSWDDLGNYYGAGAFGLSVFDNSLQIHFKTAGKGTSPELIRILPGDTGIGFINYLTASGTTDNGYIFLAPYSNKGWISGTIPENKDDFVLNGSIPDPPMYLASVLHEKLVKSGIKIKGKPVTTRVMQGPSGESFHPVSETLSPPLYKIIEVLNHKSVNLYAEHLIKELGRVFKNSGTTEAGVEVVKSFLDSIGISSGGIFMEDGSGLSPRDAVTSAGMVNLLYYLKKNGRFFEEYFMSLPEAGKEGTLKNYFKDPLFESRLRAKSGSMAKVRSYAGYLTALSGKEIIFCIIVNNYTGPSRQTVAGIEEILKNVILNN